MTLRNRLCSATAVLLVVGLAGGGVLAAQQATPRLPAVDALLEQAIARGDVPGAVVIIGSRGKIVHRRAYGLRSLEPAREPMTLDTVFDAASLTKPVATAMSVMRLFELGQIRLNDPVARYLPEFAKDGKAEVTIRQLLTHFSGLRGDLDLDVSWSGTDEALRRMHEEKLVNPPGAQFIYSDIGYIALGEVVRRVSGMPLEKYAEAHVFAPLGMTHTRFLPPAEWRARIAPTEYDERGVMLRGVVHDPTARRMGGIAGHAGMFTTADDLAKFAQAILDGKTGLSPLTIVKMTTPQQPPTATVQRGLGWDIDSPFASNRGELLPVGSFGHTGFTGTSLWIDPTTQTYVIILANGVHPKLPPAGTRIGNPVVSLRSRVATAVTTALNLHVSDAEKLRLARITGYNEAATASRRITSRNGKVRTGIDVLAASNFEALRAPDGRVRNIGVLTNQNGVDSAGRRTIDLLAKARGIKLAAIFSPEHGATGRLDTSDIGDSVDAATGVRVYSVYGAKDEQRRPSLDVLKTLDAIVIDLQNAGARFYTYETTLGYFLEAAVKSGTQVIVLDRPNPATGAYVQGPLRDPGREAFVNYHTLPVRHGMTMGELAQLFNAERGIGAKLKVVTMEGWMRGDWYDSTGLLWIDPSPNLRSVTAAALYPGVELLQYTNVSVGRGTGRPFELVGAPWVNARELAEYLNARQISGVRFVPVEFTPTAATNAKQLCGGVNIVLLDRHALDAPLLGVELVSAMHQLYGEKFQLAGVMTLLANQEVLDAIAAGHDPRRIADDWRDEVEAFERVRAKYLLYAK